MVKQDGSQQKIAEKVLDCCWSKKGKQLAIGKSDGKLMQVTADGTVKKTMDPPPDVLGKLESVYWLEDTLFLLIFTSFTDSPEEVSESFVYALFIDKETKQAHFTSLMDPASAFGNADRKQRYYVQSLKDW